MTAALIIGLLVAVPLGLISARWPGRASDHAIRAGSILGVSMPIFWLALILQLVFSNHLHLLPAAGEFSPSLLFTHPLTRVTGFGLIDAPLTGNWPMFGSILGHLLLPALVVAAYPAGLLTRMIRAQVLDTIGETHVMVWSLARPGQRAEMSPSGTATTRAMISAAVTSSIEAGAAVPMSDRTGRWV